MELRGGSKFIVISWRPLRLSPDAEGWPDDFFGHSSQAASGHIRSCAQQSQNTMTWRDRILAAGQRYYLTGISTDPRSKPIAASLNDATGGGIQSNCWRRKWSPAGVRPRLSRLWIKLERLYCDACVTPPRAQHRERRHRPRTI